MALRINPGYKSLNLYFDQPTNAYAVDDVDTGGTTQVTQVDIRTDLQGLKVWVRSTSWAGADPTNSELYYDGPFQGYLAIDKLTQASTDLLADNTTYYIKYAFISKLQITEYTILPLASGNPSEATGTTLDVTSPIVGYLTRDPIEIPTDSDGSNPVYTGATGTFKVYRYGQDISTNAAVTYAVSTATGGVTAAFGTGVNKNVYSVTAITDLTGTIKLTATYTDPQNNANTITIEQILNVSKRRPGQTAPLVVLTATGQVFVLTEDSSGSTKNPSSIKLIATASNVTNPTYTWVLDPDGTNTPIVGTGAGYTGGYLTGTSLNTNKDELTISSSIFTGATPQFKLFSVTVGSSVVGSTISVRDRMSVYYLKEGSDSLAMGLINENQTVTLDKTGTAISGLPIESEAVVVEGTTQITAPTVTFAVNSQSGFGGSLSINTAANNPIAGKPAGYIRATQVTANQATATITATVAGTTLSKVLTVNRVQDGADGTNIDAQLTNDFHAIPTAADGTGGVYTGASTTIEVYKNGVLQTSGFTFYVSGLQNVKYRGTGDISDRTGTGVINGALTATSGTATLNIVELSADSGYVDIIAKQTSDGQLFTERFSLSRNKAGVIGKDAVIYEIKPNAKAISKQSSDVGTDAVHTPSTLVFSIYKTVGNNTPALLTDQSLYYIQWNTPDAEPSNTDAYAILVPVTGLVSVVLANSLDRTSVNLKLLYKNSENNYTQLDREEVPVLFKGAKGDSGTSVDIVFARGSSPPSLTGTGNPPNASWSTSVSTAPGTGLLWSSTGYSSDGGTTWSWDTAVQVEGVDGTNGESIAEISAFARTTTNLSSSTISGGSYNFSNKTLTVPTGGSVTWYAAIPTGTDPLWETRTTAAVTAPTTVDSTLSWSTPVKVAQNGTDAKVLKLTADSYIFSADASNSISGFITLTANKQNTTNQVTWSTSPSVSLYTASTGGSITTTGDTVYLRAADFSTNTKVTITASITADSLSDSTSIVRIPAGENAVNVVFSNPNHPLPTSSAGVVSSYIGSGTTIQVYQAGSARTITAITATGTGITAGSISGLNSNTVTIADHSALTSTSSATVKYDITYTKQNGSSGTISDTQTVYKNKDGASGKVVYSARVWLQTSSAPAAPTGGNFNASTGVLTAPSGWTITQPSVSTTPTYASEYTFVVDPGTTTNTGGTWSTPFIDSVRGSDGSAQERVELYLATSDGSTPTVPTSVLYTITGAVLGTVTGGTAGWSLTMPAVPANPGAVFMTTAVASSATPGTQITLGTWSTPVKVAQNGANGTSPVFIDLSNDNVSVATLANGTGGTYTSANTNVTLTSGTTDVLSSATISITPSTGVTYTYTRNGTATTGATTATNLTTGTTSLNVNITAISGQDSGTLTIVATYNSIAYTAVFTVSKAKAGSDGSPATVYEVEASGTFNINVNTNAITPASITYSAFSTTGTAARVAYSSGSIVTERSTDGSTWTTIATTNAATATLLSSSLLTATRFVRARLYTGTNGTGTLVDQESTALSVSGTDGANGAPARGVDISGGLSVKYNSSTSTYSPATLTLTAVPQNITPTTYTWSGSGATFSSTNAVSTTITPTSTSSISITVQISDGTNTAQKTITIAVANDGGKGDNGIPARGVDISGGLSVKYNNSTSTYSPATLTLTAVPQNITPTTYTWSGSGATFSSTNAVSTTITPTSTSSISITVQISDGTNTAQKTITIAVANDGAAGQVGQHGKKSAMPALYTWTSSASAPTKPTSSEYYWNTVGANTAGSLTITGNVGTAGSKGYWYTSSSAASSALSPTNGDYLWELVAPITVDAATWSGSYPNQTLTAVNSTTITWSSWTAVAVGYRGTNGTSTAGAAGAGMYAIERASGATISAPTTAEVNTATGRSVGAVEGDVATVYISGQSSVSYRYLSGTWSTITTFLSGNLIVQNSIAANKLVIGNSTGNNRILLTDNTIEVYEGNVLRVKIGQL